MCNDHSWSIHKVAHLRVNADGLAALLAPVSKDALVALDTVGVFIPQDISLTSQRLVALPAAEVSAMPVLVHGLGVFAAENKLWTNVDVIGLGLRHEAIYGMFLDFN